jgi:hypothetical protein
VDVLMWGAIDSTGRKVCFNDSIIKGACCSETEQEIGQELWMCAPQGPN